MSAQLTVTLSPDDDRTWTPRHPYDGDGEVRVSVIGEADLCTARQLRCALIGVLRQQPAVVVVDLAGLSFCDVRGLDALQDALVLSRATGVRMSWQAASPLLQWMHDAFPPGRTR